MEDSRISWDHYFMKIAEVASERGTCIRRRVGAVAVRNNQILATGYNGSPMRAKHCSELGGCLRTQLNVPSGERHELCRAVHAEQNVVTQAARNGSMLLGATVYTTLLPCSICMKLLINAGVTTVVYSDSYDDKLSYDLAAECGVYLKHLHK